jgi:hypothetical protein
VSKQDQPEIPQRVNSAMKPALAAIKTFQSRLEQWEDLGGPRAAAEQARVLVHELKAAAEQLEKLTGAVDQAAIAAEREEPTRYYRILEQVSKKSGLKFDGQLNADLTRSSTLRLGHYDVEIKAGKGILISFVGSTLGNIRTLDENEALSQFAEIRRLAEVETKDFLKILDRAYDASVPQGKREARIGDVLRRFIIELQPSGFWFEAQARTLRPYTHANFAWEILREAHKDGFPYKFASANVHANIAAAGQKSRDGNLLLVLQEGTPPRLYSTISKVPKGG